MRAKLTLQQLEAFARVAATGNFRAAALALNVSQPSLSRTVRVAEEQLGTRLFDRDTRHVELTAAGHELLPIARRILGEFDDAFSELSQFLEGRSGRITVAALPSASVALLPDAVAAFRRQHPQVEFSVVEAPAQALLAAVDEGRVDFGISVQPAPHQRLHYRHLMDDPFVLLMRRDDELATRTSVPWSLCARRPFLASAPGSSIRPMTDAVFLQKGMVLRPAFDYPSVAMGGAMVAAGLGVAALPRLALRLTDTGNLAALSLRQPSLVRRIGIVLRIGRSLSPAARAFMESLPARQVG
ncbi:MAG: LysR family transcriptional regulator [Variovorax sp.]|nr:LysR family transcriptional regulator [Variovorax sp.]